MSGGIEDEIKIANDILALVQQLRSIDTAPPDIAFHIIKAQMHFMACVHYLADDMKFYFKDIREMEYANHHD